MAIDALHADMIHFQEEKNVIALQVTFTDYVSGMQVHTSPCRHSRQKQLQALKFGIKHIKILKLETRAIDVCISHTKHMHEKVC